MRLLIVWMIFSFGLTVAEARGIRSIADRLPQVIKRADIGKFVAMGALGTILLCSPSCEHGDRMVDGGFTRSGTPAINKVTYQGRNLPYSLGMIIGNQQTGRIQETQHSGATVKLTYAKDPAVELFLERHDVDEGVTYGERFYLYPRGTSGSFDIYDSRTGGTDIGDGYGYDDGRTRYTFEAGNGVEITFLVSRETGERPVRRTLGSRGIYASKRVSDGQDHRGQPRYRQETFSLMGLPAHHFLTIGTNAQLSRSD